MAWGEYLSNTGTTVHSENTLKDMITLKEEFSGTARILNNRF
jgi:hypothetical protein